ncbi:MAG TPA: hypothetical protein VFF65_08995 [Phycisphaerales bacterium]|nr:hypothetical protein [Phycisphaerales bacterium]
MSCVRSISVLACAAVAGVVLAQPPGGGGASPTAPGRGLTVKDFVRVEQGRGDAGGLGTSLAKGPATVGTPGDFSGVYQIPEDADSPYAGWYARVQGAVIAVFPRGDYVSTEGGMAARIPANTRYFIGSVPLNTPGVAKRRPTTVDRIDDRVDARSRDDQAEEPYVPAPDGPRPVTLDTATTAEGVRTAIEKLCADPVYRAHRVRELLERAASGER